MVYQALDDESPECPGLVGARTDRTAGGEDHRELLLLKSGRRHSGPDPVGAPGATASEADPERRSFSGTGSN